MINIKPAAGFVTCMTLCYAPMTHAVTLDTGSDTAYLRVDCAEYAATTCTTELEDIVTWLDDPSRTEPVIVDVGPGVYATSYQGMLCNNGVGNFTFRGAGKDVTVLTGGKINRSVIQIRNCPNVQFEDLTIRSDAYLGGSGSTWGVAWYDGGNSTWTNINIEAQRRGWSDSSFTPDGWGGTCGTATEVGTHNFFSTRIHVNDGNITIGFTSSCGNNSLYSSEILTLNHDISTPSYGMIGLYSAGNFSKTSVYGSTIRSITQDDATTQPGSLGQIGVYVEGGASYEMHSGIISMTNKEASFSHDLVSIYANGAGTNVNTTGTAFGLVDAGQTTFTRIRKNPGSVVDAPFQWPASATPPDIISTNGSDVFFDTSDTHPHLMIYDDSCPTANPGSDPWFDTVTGDCRD